MKNVLIIGGGIAGGSLALQLIEQNINVTVLDRGQNYSSVIASGMVNPMVFRRMNLSWRAAEMLPYARSFYNDLEQKFGIEFLADLKIRRFFSSDQERGYWEKKQHQSGYNDFLTVHSDFHKQVPNAKSEFGSGLVKSAFWIRSEVFMTGLHDYLSKQGVLNTAFFNENLFNASKLTYGSEKYDAVVFCCGSANNKISFFTNRSNDILVYPGSVIFVPRKVNSQEAAMVASIWAPILSAMATSITALSVLNRD